MMKAVLVVHGGAWAIPDLLAEASVEGVKAAAREGYGVLGTGGSALDAVEKAVRAMEDNTVFDAGEHFVVVVLVVLLVYHRVHRISVKLNSGVGARQNDILHQYLMQM